MHLACVFDCLLMFELAARILDNINRIYEREFSGLFKETNRILGLRTSTNNILNRRGKNLPQFVQKMDEKNKNKNNRCCKASCVNTQMHSFAKIFENIFILITFIRLEHFLNEKYTHAT